MNYLGNYWSDYTGTDANGNGIGDPPYSINGDQDNYPLMEPFEKYIAQARYTIYATRIGLVGETTANGHVIQPHDNFVALPSTKALCQNDAEHGHDYEVRITYKGRSIVAPVWDVGPWNTKDDYWNPPSEREMWQDLPQGIPEAQAAFQRGYNDGFDETNYLIETATNTDKFDVGDRVGPIIDGLKVRSTAGGNEIGFVSKNDVGTVMDGPQRASLEGMDYRWWEIQWDNGLCGWSASNRYVLNPAGIDLANGAFWDGLGMTDNDWATVEFLWTIENQPPICTIELQKDEVEINEVDVGEFFKIYVGDSTDDTGIKEVRFSSDDLQDGIPTGEWTEYYDWGVSSGNWDYSTKIKCWSFARTGDKEVWVEIKDDIGQTDRNYANILAKEWSFAIITDLHIGRGYPDYGGPGWRDTGTTGQDYYLTERLKEVVDWINRNHDNPEHNIRFVVVLGDITDSGEYSELEKAKDILDGLQIPYIPVIGNHDVWSKVEGSSEIPIGDWCFYKTFDETFFENQFSKMGDVWWDNEDGSLFLQNYIFSYGGVDFICLDFIPRDITTIRTWRAFIHDETKAWLKKWLEDPARENPTVLFSHHPLAHVERYEVDLAFEDDDLMRLKEEIQGWEKVNADFAGHVHGYYTPNEPWTPQIKSPYFIDANRPYINEELGILAVTTEALMVESNEPDSEGFIRIVQMDGNSIKDYNTIKGDYLTSLNPYFKEVEWSPRVDIDWTFPLPKYNLIWEVEFELYAFTKHTPVSFTLDVGHDDGSLSGVQEYWWWPIELEYNYPPEGGIYDVKLVVDGKESITRKLDLPVWDFSVHALSPVDIILTDPDGFTVSKQLSEVPGAVYFETDLDEDGDIDDIIVLPDRKIGDYFVTVIPESDASPTETYTVGILTVDNEVISLADNVKINDIPDQPYLIESTETGINAAPIADAEIEVEFQPKPMVEDPDDNYIIEGNAFGGTDITLTGATSYNPEGGVITYSWFNEEGNILGIYEVLDVFLPLDHHQITLTVSDGELSSFDVLDVTIQDTSPPILTIETPLEHEALQDGITLIAFTWDVSTVSSLTFSIREPDGEQGKIISPAFESMVATLSSDDGWQLPFDTTQLPDGYYLVVVESIDVFGNGGFQVVPFSIRNWAAIELLPASETNKVGRTMPIKFSLRIAASVDPNQPFVRNEELTIIILEKDNSGDILQTSTYEITARDYRIDDLDELYITNFKTLKTPTTYVVEIYRKGMLIGTLEFSTVNKRLLFV